jgi:thiol peroxidase
MAFVTFKGNRCRTSGNLPAVGSAALDFNLVGSDLAQRSLASFAGKNVVLSVFPSIDTGVCAASVRNFNQAVGESDQTVVVNVSMDLPFAHKRFCESEGLAHVVNLSAFRSPEFADDYGLRIEDGPLKGLLARAVVVINSHGEVIYTELVPEIAQEPDYQAAFSSIEQIV